MNNLEQIRIHGRGGQGVVTAAELIAIAAFYDGLEAQAFPNFGVERTGAPIQAYARISKKKITTREQIYEPTVLIIQDSSLLDSGNILAGISDKTKIIINAKENRWDKLKNKKNLYFSPATEIALEMIGKNIVNTVILGAFAKYTKLVSLASLKKAIETKFKDKGEEIVAKNIKAIEKAFLK
ncbi:pyruvate ferredoxin oxidoreductase [Candidatus Falkowbacteria bacterium]|nr:pyruvate ferredoxin oxidoreductase [Candidatus Falkowbacteria bacterium]